MTIQQLKYIVEVSKCSSISQAADNLFLSQPALSKSIRDLEEELKITILKRSNTNTRFTDEGKELLSYARQLLEQAELIEHRFLKKDGQKHRFSISSQHYAFTIKALIALLNHDPDTAFDFYFRECKTHEIIEDVYTTKSDIGILYLSPSAEKYLKRSFQLKGIVFTPLRVFTPHVFLRKEHPLAGHTSISLKQLEDYTCLCYDQDNQSMNFSEEILTASKSKRSVYLYDRAAVNNLIAHTDSYNIGTGYLAEGIIEEQIISIPLEESHETMTVGWIKLKNLTLPPQIETYIKFLEEAIHHEKKPS